MASVYVCNVIGTGTRTDSFRPSIAADVTSVGGWYSVLMIDTDPTKMKAMVVTTVDGITGTGVITVLTGTDRADLIATARATQLSGARRTTINNWLTNAGYPTLPAGAQTLAQAIITAARFVNPGVDLDLTGID